MTDLGQSGGSVLIARCPEHGLHGERQKCFVCGGPVEQVEMVPVAEHEGTVEAIKRAMDEAHKLSRDTDDESVRLVQAGRCDGLAEALDLVEATEDRHA